MKYSFESFCDGSFDWNPINNKRTGLWLRQEKMDISGGRISISDIDRLKEYPEADTVMISGLRQDTFEYFINTYGNQLKAICFFKNKFIEDWSLLGTLPHIQYLYFFSNQRIERFWDMNNNRELTGLAVMDFSRIKDVELVSTAPALEDFRIGNEIWSTMVINSLMPLAGTPIKYLSFVGKNIINQDLSFLDSMPYLETFDFPTNLFTTEQVAWIAANHPEISGFAITPYTGYPTDKEPDSRGWVVGRRKPYLKYRGNEERIRKYEKAFAELKDKYRGIPYREAFETN
ncbi:MAG: internalin [Clostridia bacterium]|nr:internalin [Clostridia bacterium]